MVPEDLLDGSLESWKSVVVYYEGVFSTRKEQVTGSGAAEITHVDDNYECPKGQVLIHVQGVVGPILTQSLPTTYHTVITRTGREKKSFRRICPSSTSRKGEIRLPSGSVFSILTVRYWLSVCSTKPSL